MSEVVDKHLFLKVDMSGRMSPPAVQSGPPRNVVALSPAQRLNHSQHTPAEEAQHQNNAETPPPEADAPQGPSPEEQRIIAELQRTDREVRAHENAHLAAAGGLARGVSFQYTTGPDGRQYAVAGEVSIDASPVSGDPQATIQKAQQVRAAASAPANPSGQDRQVAAQAAQLEAAARIELSAQQREELDEQLQRQQGDQYDPTFNDAGAQTERILDLIA